MARLVSVAVPVPGLDLLTYSVPDHLDMPPSGVRVLVPLGTRVVTGCLVGAAPDPAAADTRSSEEPGRIRSIIDVLDEEAYLPDDVVNVARWVADYYLAGPGETIAAAMPPGAWIESERAITIQPDGLAQIANPATLARGEESHRRRVLEALASGRTMTVGALSARVKRSGGQTDDGEGIPMLKVVRALEREGLVAFTQTLSGRRSAHKTHRVVALTAAGHELADDSTGGTAKMSVDVGATRLSDQQRATLGILAGAAQGLPAAEFARRGGSPQTLRGLTGRGLVSIRHERVERDPFEGVPLYASTLESVPLTLTEEQSVALAHMTALADRQDFRVALLHGVTGSGKTELYVRLAERVHASGRSVLMLVPEIGLTPQVALAFRATFGGRVAVQHSGLSDGERYDQWQRIRRNEVDVVIGTRSAVFAPLEHLGLIVVDEEHDASYKQEESPRYHGRDVAIVRGQQAGALVVLGSATPSMESYQNALTGRYERIVLERRVLDRPLADVSIVDMRAEFAAEGPDVVLSGALKSAIAARLARHEQALVLLNRRGLATAVFCRQCAAMLDCPNCSVSLTVHTTGRSTRRARCHYCNYSMALPKQCATCAAPYLEYVGFGTERVETEVRQAFPTARVGRLDRDTARRRGAIADLLDRFRRREIDVLVGTQMIAKGHDFPFVTLVGVVSADVGLGLADFRAAERTFQLLTQVAGRAGRGTEAGQAIVQTIHPATTRSVMRAGRTIRRFLPRRLPFAGRCDIHRSWRWPTWWRAVRISTRRLNWRATSLDASASMRRPRGFVCSAPLRRPM